MDALELELQVIVSLVWVLGTKKITDLNATSSPRPWFKVFITYWIQGTGLKSPVVLEVWTPGRKSLPREALGETPQAVITYFFFFLDM